MNWVDIYKTLEIVRNNLFNDIYVTEESTTYTAPKNGYYKIICVGAGGDSEVLGWTNNKPRCTSGSGGGVAIKTKRLSKGTNLSITITESTPSANGGASCDGMFAGNGGKSGQTGKIVYGGTATGGDENYDGQSNEYSDSKNPGIVNGGSVGCFFYGITMRDTASLYNTDNGTVYGGFGILGHGGGGGCVANYNANASERMTYAYVKGQPAGVIIIPLPLLS